MGSHGTCFSLLVLPLGAATVSFVLCVRAFFKTGNKILTLPAIRGGWTKHFHRHFFWGGNPQKPQCSPSHKSKLPKGQMLPISNVQGAVGKGGGHTANIAKQPCT